ncbi:MAG: Uma2 family endonuclease [Firmicutes bacterium]|nr:Uma2 family endonuclease [Bacillota bacterium]
MPFGDGADLYLSENNRFVPGSMIVCDRDKIKTRCIYGAPDLVIEILSPSTAKMTAAKRKTLMRKPVYANTG